MLKDYKFTSIKRDADGFTTEATLRFYKGENRMVPAKDPKNHHNLIDVNQYVRTATIQTQKFTAADFGQIKSDQQLANFCNDQLNKFAPLLLPIKKQIIGAIL